MRSTNSLVSLKFDWSKFLITDFNGYIKIKGKELLLGNITSGNEIKYKRCKLSDFNFIIQEIVNLQNKIIKSRYSESDYEQVNDVAIFKLFINFYFDSKLKREKIFFNHILSIQALRENSIVGLNFEVSYSDDLYEERIREFLKSSSLQGGQYTEYKKMDYLADSLNILLKKHQSSLSSLTIINVMFLPEHLIMLSKNVSISRLKYFAYRDDYYKDLNIDEKDIVNQSHITSYKKNYLNELVNFFNSLPKYTLKTLNIFLRGIKKSDINKAEFLKSFLTNNNVLEELILSLPESMMNQIERHSLSNASALDSLIVLCPDDGEIQFNLATHISNLKELFLKSLTIINTHPGSPETYAKISEDFPSSLQALNIAFSDLEVNKKVEFSLFMQHFKFIIQNTSLTIINSNWFSYAIDLIDNGEDELELPLQVPLSLRAFEDCINLSLLSISDAPTLFALLEVAIGLNNSLLKISEDAAIFRDVKLSAQPYYSYYKKLNQNALSLDGLDWELPINAYILLEKSRKAEQWAKIAFAIAFVRANKGSLQNSFFPLINTILTYVKDSPTLAIAQELVEFKKQECKVHLAPVKDLIKNFPEVNHDESSALAIELLEPLARFSKFNALSNYLLVQNKLPKIYPFCAGELLLQYIFILNKLGKLSVASLQEMLNLFQLTLLDNMSGCDPINHMTNMKVSYSQTFSSLWVSLMQIVLNYSLKLSIKQEAEIRQTASLRSDLLDNKDSKEAGTTGNYVNSLTATTATLWQSSAAVGQKHKACVLEEISADSKTSSKPTP